MSGSTITMGPTMANPEAFDTVPELREQLHNANRAILQLTGELHSLNCVVQDLISERLARMVLGHMRGDQDAVRRELDDIVANHVKIVQQPQGGLH
ncbi:hypothetical protein [Ralstonia syzygii]|uniref:hypothetical protein n=1 Tax=Ralstonia syzygii TaxID=28097 RepID=UPI0035155183